MDVPSKCMIVRAMRWVSVQVGEEAGGRNRDNTQKETTRKERRP
jgi:hypothetical protein